MSNFQKLLVQNEMSSSRHCCTNSTSGGGLGTSSSHSRSCDSASSSSSSSSWSSPRCKRLSRCKRELPLLIPTRRRRRPAEPWIFKNGLFILLIIISFLLMASLCLSICFILRRMEETAPPKIGSTWKDLVDSNNQNNNPSVTCREARQKVATGLWTDPNQGQVYSRPTLVSHPPFAMAVHKESYDPVRWEHIYIKGKYYKDWVHARFVEILAGPGAVTAAAVAAAVAMVPQRGLLRSRSDSVLDKQEKAVSLILDVGANIGYYTMLSMALGYSVVAFEINPPNLLRMCESLELNHWALPENDAHNDSQPQVRMYQQGVSNIDGEVLEVLVPKNTDQAYMKSDVETSEQQNEHEPPLHATNFMHNDQTSTITLDTFAQQHGWLIPQPDGYLAVNPNIEIKILKIDVDGKEPLVVEGAQALLRSAFIENILIVFRRLAHPNVQQALLLLLESGYTLVHEKEGKVSLTRSKELLADLTTQLKGTQQTVDLWFQRI